MGGPQRIRLTLSPAAARYAQRDAPVEARRLAASGALPLPPVEIAAVLFALLHDPDPEVKERARRSLESLPPAVGDAVLSGPAHPAVLSYLARVHRDDPARLEKLALNPAADDGTLAFLASLPHRPVVEIVAQNQARLLRAPEIVEAIGANPVTGRALVDRVLSFLGFHGAGPAAAGEPEAPPAEGEVSDREAEAALRALLGEEAEGLIGAARGDLDEHARGNLYAAVQRMNVVQKVQLARHGNREARALLVRDPNKLVATAAVRSPALGEDEVVGFAKSRNVCDDVLRAIADHREWTRSYAVKLALATNPKTPPPRAMSFLNYLQERDLRQVARSREVPAAISTHARRILGKKGKR